MYKIYANYDLTRPNIENHKIVTLDILYYKTTCLEKIAFITSSSSFSEDRILHFHLYYQCLPRPLKNQHFRAEPTWQLATVPVTGSATVVLLEPRKPGKCRRRAFYCCTARASRRGGFERNLESDTGNTGNTENREKEKGNCRKLKRTQSLV